MPVNADQGNADQGNADAGMDALSVAVITPPGTLIPTPAGFGNSINPGEVDGINPGDPGTMPFTVGTLVIPIVMPTGVSPRSFGITLGDTALVYVILRDATGGAVNLTGQTVVVHIADFSNRTLTPISATGNLTSVLGQVQFSTAGITRKGYYAVEFKTSIGTGLTFPNDSHALLYVNEQLA